MSPEGNRRRNRVAHVGRRDYSVPASPVPGRLVPASPGARVTAALCPHAPHPHVERRYLLLPCLRFTGSVRLGGIVSRAAHPKSGPLTGAPQMVEISHDGRRVYFTSSLYAAWDEQF